MGKDTVEKCLEEYEDVFAETKNVLSLFNWKAILLAVGIYILTNNKKVKPHPILVIVIAAAVGVVFKF